MKKALRVAVLSVIGVAILLIILNPNVQSFKNYARDLGDPKYAIYKRQANYFLFSIFIKEGADKPQKYCGIAGNFFEITDNPLPVSDEQPNIIQQPTVKELDFGPNAVVWVEEICSYLKDNPNATDSELYKRFPKLDNDSAKLTTVGAYCYAKTVKKQTDSMLKILFPELYKKIKLFH